MAPDRQGDGGRRETRSVADASAGIQDRTGPAGLALPENTITELEGALREAVWTATPDLGAIRFVNPAFETIYGRSSRELVDNPRVWLACIHPDDASRVTEALMRTGEPVASSIDYRIVRSDGSERWIDHRTQCIRDDRGQTVLVAHVAEDITARMELAAILDAGLADRIVVLQRVVDELEGFTRNVAHNLKSPLNSILSMSGLLRTQAGSRLMPIEQRYLGLIERSSREMASLVNDLMTLSRAGSAEPRCERVDLAPMIRAEVEQLRTQHPFRDVVVTIPATLEMACDEGLMHAVVQNLLSNAWKFTAERPTAHIAWAVTQGEGTSTLKVSDDGVGFTVEDSDHVFQPFQRFHPAGRFAGNGLGLAVCQRVVQRLGGHMSVHSRPGAGTDVRITLPQPPALRE